MKKLLTYEVNGEALLKNEDKVINLLKGWLIDKNKLDVVITSFATEEFGSINIDCNWLDGTEKVRKLTEQFFDELGIVYQLETDELEADKDSPEIDLAQVNFKFI